MNKQKLKEYTWIKKNIDHLEIELLSLESRATKVTPHISDEPNSKGYRQDKTADLVAAMIDTKILINKQLEKLYKIRLEIEESISDLPEKEQYLMRARYLENKTWEQICVDMSYCWKQIHRIHSKALKAIS